MLLSLTPVPTISPSLRANDGTASCTSRQCPLARDHQGHPCSYKLCLLLCSDGDLTLGTRGAAQCKRVLEKGLTGLGLVLGDLGEGLKKQGFALA